MLKENPLVSIIARSIDALKNAGFTSKARIAEETLDHTFNYINELEARIQTLEAKINDRA